MEKYVVYIQEEYGYRDWLWVPSMTKEELAEWWKNLPSVSPFFFSGPVDFPGEVHQIYLHNENDFRFVEEGEGRVVHPIHEDMLSLPENVIRMHIHEDMDSYLTIDDETIYHAGYMSLDEYYEQEVSQEEIDRTLEKAKVLLEEAAELLE